METFARCCRLAALLLVLAAGRLAAQGVATPLVRVTDVRPAPGGASGAFVGRVDGEAGVFKASLGGATAPELVMRTGNVEAEYLASRMLEVAGIDAPRVRLVRIAGRPGLHAMSPYVGETFSGQPVTKNWADASLPPFPSGADPVTARAWSEAFAARFDADSVRRLQVLDLLIGNGDRNRGNAFLATGSDGRLRMVPIDHDRGFVTRALKPDTRVAAGSHGYHRHLVQGFQGQGSFAPAASVAGTPARILLGNEIYETIARTSTAEQYRAAAEDLARRFDDHTIARLVDELPAEIGAARKRELVQLLSTRRAGLAAAASSLHAPAPARPADRLARALALDGRPVTSAMREFLAGPLTAPDGTVRAEAAYADLRARGVPPADARAAVEAGVELLRWDRAAPGPAELARTLADAEVRISGRPPERGGVRATLSEAFVGARMRLALFGVDREPIRARLQDLDRRHATLDRALVKLRAADAAGPSAAESSAGRATQARLVERQRTLVDEYVAHTERLGEQHGRGPSAARVERTLAALRAQELAPYRTPFRTRAEGAPPTSKTPRAPDGTRLGETRPLSGAQAVRASVAADLRGGLAVTTLIAAGTDFLSRLQQGAPAGAATRGALASLARPEFLLGDLAGGTLGAAVGAAIPLPAALAGASAGFTASLARSIPPLALSMLAARLGASAIQLAREDRLSAANLFGSLDWTSTLVQALGGALGAQLALSAISAGLLPALALGPVALVPIVAGIGGALAAEKLLQWWRDRESGAAAGVAPGDSVTSPSTASAPSIVAAARARPVLRADPDDLFGTLPLAGP